MVFVRMGIFNSKTKKISNEKIFNFVAKKTLFIGSGDQSDILIRKNYVLDTHIIMRYTEDRIILTAIGNNVYLNKIKIMQKDTHFLNRDENFCIKFGNLILENFFEKNIEEKRFMRIKNSEDILTHSLRKKDQRIRNMFKEHDRLSKKFETEEKIFKEILEEKTKKYMEGENRESIKMTDDPIKEILNAKEKPSVNIDLPNLEDLPKDNLKKFEEEDIEVRETDTKIGEPKKGKKRRVLYRSSKKGNKNK